MQLIQCGKEAVKFDSQNVKPSWGNGAPLKALVKELVWEEKNSDEILFLATFEWVEELMESQGRSMWRTAGAADLQLGREV